MVAEKFFEHIGAQLIFDRGFLPVDLSVFNPGGLKWPDSIIGHFIQMTRQLFNAVDEVTMDRGQVQKQ